MIGYDEGEPGEAAAGRFELWFRRIFATVLLLWPEIISPDPFGKWWGEPRAQEAPLSPPTGGPKKKELFPPKFDGGLDRDAFLGAFRRQAQAQLLPCLRSAITDRRSLVLVGVLSRSGKLSQIASINPNEFLPECAPPLITAMDFAHLSQGLKDNELRLHWRIDW